MKTKESKCEICGKIKPISEMAETWRESIFFQLYPSMACHDEKNCKPVTQHVK